MNIYKTKAKEALSNNWGAAIIACIVFGIAVSLTSSISAGLAYLILWGPLSIAYCLFMMSLIRNEKIEMADLCQRFINNFLHKFFAGILTSLYTFLWSLLLVVPGIVKSYSYAMTFYIMADDETITANDAINKSQKMMDGNKLQLFLLDLSFLGWYLLSFVTFGFALLYAEPYHQAARAAFYEELKNKNENPYSNCDSRERSYYQTAL